MSTPKYVNPAKVAQDAILASIALLHMHTRLFMTDLFYTVRDYLDEEVRPLLVDILMLAYVEEQIRSRFGRPWEAQAGVQIIFIMLGQVTAGFPLAVEMYGRHLNLDWAIQFFFENEQMVKTPRAIRKAIIARHYRMFQRAHTTMLAEDQLLVGAVFAARSMRFFAEHKDTNFATYLTGYQKCAVEHSIACSEITGITYLDLPLLQYYGNIYGRRYPQTLGPWRQLYERMSNEHTFVNHWLIWKNSEVGEMVESCYNQGGLSGLTLDPNAYFISVTEEDMMNHIETYCKLPPRLPVDRAFATEMPPSPAPEDPPSPSIATQHAHSPAPAFGRPPSPPRENEEVDPASAMSVDQLEYPPPLPDAPQASTSGPSAHSPVGEEHLSPGIATQHAHSPAPATSRPPSPPRENEEVDPTSAMQVDQPQSPSPLLDAPQASASGPSTHVPEPAPSDQPTAPTAGPQTMMEAMTEDFTRIFYHPRSEHNSLMITFEGRWGRRYTGMLCDTYLPDVEDQVEASTWRVEELRRRVAAIEAELEKLQG